MLEFATKHDENELKSIWETVFQDTDFFIKLHFSHNFLPVNTLVFRNKGKIVATLFMHPYEFRFWGEPVQCYYLSGLATLPRYRRQGIMHQLINFAYKVMKERNIPLAILIPAKPDMYAYYRKFGYEQVFDSNTETIPLASIIDENKSLSESYTVFDSIYRQKDFCIQKDFSDFKAIVADWEYDQRPPKTNVAGMAQLITPHFLFNIYRQKTGKKFKLNFLKDDDIILKDNVLSVSNRMLCRLLFGFHITEFAPEMLENFPEHQPILNLMLE
ncbi:hypothetical protein FACS189429_2680 [Bacteroidia bacterium]|nr:hypothetical protein FACS189429_2680 [Bacteroidia bacterium]GHV43718.1 hypothetical protein FACS1894180_3630 [Bacteroidia bacterium]